MAPWPHRVLCEGREFDPKEFIVDNMIKINTIFEMDEEIIKNIEAQNKRKIPL